jgi:hypothetical protein
MSMSRTVLLGLLIVVGARADISHTSRGMRGWIPIEHGWTWVFVDSNGAKSEMTMAKPTTFGGERCIPLKFSNLGNQGPTTMYVTVTRKGARIHGYSMQGISLRMDPPMKLLGPRPREGQKWDYDGAFKVDLGGNEAEMPMKAKVEIKGIESIKAAGRTLRCLPVKMGYSQQMGGTSATFYLARGLGVVKIVSGGTGLFSSMTLKEIKR